MKKIICLIILLLYSGNLSAAVPEVKAHVNDYAGVMNAAQVSALEAKLTTHEQQTSNQVAVVVIPTLSGGNLEDTSMKICEKWKGGLKGKDNGVLLFVVVNDHKMRIEVGRGLEGALTDITCGQIKEELKPFFRNNDYAGGITSGVDNIFLAIKGEYKGTGKVVGQSKTPDIKTLKVCLIILGVILLVVSIFGALLCQIPVIGRGLSGAVNGAVMYFSALWLLSTGWAIAGAVIGGIIGIFAPEVLEVAADIASSGGGGGGWSSGGSGSSGGGGWGGGGGSFSGGGASGSW